MELIKIEKTCDNCGVSIAHLKSTAKYCGASCYKQAARRSKLVMTTCTCGCEFLPASGKQKYCGNCNSRVDAKVEKQNAKRKLESYTGIYKITSKKNGLSYIGQSVDIKKRWQQHQARFPDLDYSYEILETCNKAYLNEKELYYINHYNTVKNGFNKKEGCKVSNVWYIFENGEYKLKYKLNTGYSLLDDYINKSFKNLSLLIKHKNNIGFKYSYYENHCFYNDNTNENIFNNSQIECPLGLINNDLKNHLGNFLNDRIDFVTISKGYIISDFYYAKSYANNELLIKDRCFYKHIRLLDERMINFYDLVEFTMTFNRIKESRTTKKFKIFTPLELKHLKSYELKARNMKQIYKEHRLKSFLKTDKEKAKMIYQAIYQS